MAKKKTTSFTPERAFQLSFPREGRRDQVFMFTPQQGTYQVVPDDAQTWPIDGTHKTITASALRLIQEHLAQPEKVVEE